MQFQALDRVLVHQALINGRVTHSLTGDGLFVPLSVLLAWRIEGEPEYLDVHLQPTIKSGGFYAFYGTPTMFFPILESGEKLQCRLTVSAQGFQAKNTEFLLSQAELTPETETQEFSGFDVEIRRFDAPVKVQNISLVPDPVSLAGRVIEDNDMANPLEGVTITVTIPPLAGNVVTDETGYFRIDELPVVEKVTLKAQRNGDTITQVILLDYGRRINESIFSLSA